jgi:hypothetical protein
LVGSPGCRKAHCGLPAEHKQPLHLFELSQPALGCVQVDTEALYQLGSSLGGKARRRSRKRSNGMTKKKRSTYRDGSNIRRRRRPNSQPQFGTIREWEEWKASEQKRKEAETKARSLSNKLVGPIPEIPDPLAEIVKQLEKVVPIVPVPIDTRKNDDI